MFRTRLQTNTSGVLTWTFPRPFGSNPIVSVEVEDTGGAATDVWSVKITAISTTACTIQLVRTSVAAIGLLGISLLQVTGTPQAFCHLTAVAP